MTQEPKIFPYIAHLLQGAEVVWKPLGEVAEYIRGITYNKQAEIQHKDGWKVLRANNITLKSRQLDFNDIKVIDKSIKVRDNQHLYKGDILICAGSGSREHIGKTAYIFENLEYIFGGFMGVIRTNEEYLLSRFLFHYLGSSSFSTYLNKELNSSTINNLNSSIMNKFQIPLPPLSVQQEIVRILDKFTQLEAELEAELDCRKRQYEYYRNKLLSYEGNEVEWKTLGEVGEIRMCKRILKEETSDYGEVPFYKIGTFGKEADAYISKELFNEYRSKYNYPNVGDILISASGTIGRTVIFDGKEAYFQDSNIVWIENDEKKVHNKYLFYCYQIAKWNISEGGTILRLYNENLRKTLIPIPYPNNPKKSLEEQNRIVTILDKFDTLVNSISEGLPKEIALRRKQYEYYRERLLTFTNNQ